MAGKTFYVLTAIADVEKQVESINFHGPYDDGYDMEIAIDEGNLGSGKSIMQRLIIEDNEITRLDEPFNPAKDSISRWFPGHPPLDNPGLYWVVMKEHNVLSPFICLVTPARQLKPVNVPDNILPLAQVEKFKPINIPII